MLIVSLVIVAAIAAFVIKSVAEVCSAIMKKMISLIGFVVFITIFIWIVL